MFESNWIYMQSSSLYGKFKILRFLDICFLGEKLGFRTEVCEFCISQFLKIASSNRVKNLFSSKKIHSQSEFSSTWGVYNVVKQLNSLPRKKVLTLIDTETSEFCKSLFLKIGHFNRVRELFRLIETLTQFLQKKWIFVTAKIFLNILPWKKLNSSNANWVSGFPKFLKLVFLIGSGTCLSDTKPCGRSAKQADY